MANLSDLRTKYPQYNDLSDQELADKYYAKYYSDLPKDEFYSKIGLNQPENKTSILEDIAIASAKAIPEIASGIMEFPKEAYGAVTHPLQTLKNIPIGLAESAIGAFNLPGNITRYTAEKGYFPKRLAQYAPHIPLEELENKFGLQAKQPGEGLVRGLTGFGAFGKVGRFGEASNVRRAGLGAAYSAGQEQNPLMGAIVASIPGLIQKGQKAYSYLREPKQALRESEEALQSIGHLINEQLEAGRESKYNINRFINNVQEGLTNQSQEIESKLPHLFPILPKSATRANLANATNSATNELTEDFNQRYKSYNRDFGQKPINMPFDWQHINLDKIPGASFTTKKMGYNVSNDKLSYVDPEGNTIDINFPADHSTVEDYINFSRELRDAAWNFKKSAKNATHGEAQELRKAGNTLQQLQGQAEEKIKATVGEDAFNQFKQIQSDYSQLMAPIKTDPALFNAAYKNKISDKLHDTLLQPVNSSIRDYLFQRPEFINSLREHLLQGAKHPLKQRELISPEHENADLQYLLTPEQKAAQQERFKLQQAQDYLNQISKHLKTPETLTAQQEQKVHQFNPETSQYLTNEAQRRSLINKLEQQKTEHKITKEEKERQLMNRRNIVALGATGLALSQGKNIANLIRRLF